MISLDGSEITSVESILFSIDATEEKPSKPYYFLCNKAYFRFSTQP